MRMAKTRKPPRLVKAKTRAQYEALHRLSAFLDANNPKVIRLLVNVWDDQKAAITYKELREAILRGSLTADQFQAWQQDYAVFFNTHLSGILRDAAYAGGKDLAAARRRGAEIFAPMLDGVESWVTTHGGEWISNMTSDAREAVSTMIQYTANGNTTVDDLARRIRPLIGLTKQQGLANLRYYENLCDTLKKELLEKYPNMRETTAEIKAAAKAHESAIRYAARQHRERAAVIAQTELAFAYNKGADEACKEAVREGLLPPMVGVWDTASDEDVCPICGGLDGQKIPLGQEFQIPGRSLYSGQKMTPPAHPRCRCVLLYEEADEDTWDLTPYMTQSPTIEPSAEPQEGTVLVENPPPEPETPLTAPEMSTGYWDATSQWYAESDGSPGVVKDMMEYIAPDGTVYRVHGRDVLLDYSAHEKEIAELLVRERGGTIQMVPKVNNPQGVHTPDYLFNGVPYDLKTPEKQGKNAIYDLIKKSIEKEQAERFVVDTSISLHTDGEVLSQFESIFRSIHTRKVNEIIWVKNGKIRQVFRRAMKKKRHTVLHRINGA